LNSIRSTEVIIGEELGAVGSEISFSD
jgi:hypothetical protein